MIRGLQKQMIQLVTPKSKYFEVVFFVLRPSVSRTKESDVEMIRAAQKILLESTPRKKKEPLGAGKQRAAFFFCGLLCGGLLCGSAVAIFAAIF